MTRNELAELIECITVETMNRNTTVINEAHNEALNDLLSSKENPSFNEVFSKVFTSAMHSTIALSVTATIDTLEKMGVLTLPKE